MSTISTLLLNVNETGQWALTVLVRSDGQTSMCVYTHVLTLPSILE